jgi:hypothetical protein
MDTYSVLKLKPHDSNSTNMTFAQVNNGNAIGIQVTNSTQTADWDIALNPYGGNVGIGTIGPNSPLHVYTTAEATARFQSTDNKAEIYVYDNDTTAILGAENANIYLGSSTGSANGFLRIATTTGNAAFGAVPESSTRLKIVPRTVEIASNSTNYEKAVYASGLNFYDINSGVTDSGYRIAVDASVFVSDSDFEGTLANQYAIWARHGANVSAAGSTITRSIGVYIDSLTNTNTTITNLYGLYQEDSVAKNYFAGSVGIGTVSPSNQLTLYKATGDYFPISLQANNIGTAGTYLGIQFGYTGGTYQKGAIIYESQDAFARGKMHFALDNNANANNADIADLIMTLASSGNVGIGTTSSIGGRLHVNHPNATPNTRFSRGTGYIFDLKIDNIITNSAIDYIIEPNQASSGILFRAHNSSNTNINALAINRDGNIGIGTLNPVTSLHVSSSATNIARFSGLGTAGTYIKLDESGTQAWVMGIDNGDTTLKIRKNDYNGDVSVSFASTRQVQFNAYGSGTLVPLMDQALLIK